MFCKLTDRFPDMVLHNKSQVYEIFAKIKYHSDIYYLIKNDPMKISDKHAAADVEGLNGPLEWQYKSDACPIFGYGEIKGYAWCSEEWIQVIPIATNKEAKSLLLKR